LKQHPCKFLHSIGQCKKGEKCEFSHERLDHTQIPLYIKENEDFLDQIYKETGTTNLGQYYLQYKRDKENKEREMQREAADARLSNTLLTEDLKKEIVAKEVEDKFPSYQENRRMETSVSPPRNQPVMENYQSMNRMYVQQNMQRRPESIPQNRMRGAPQMHDKMPIHYKIQNQNQGQIQVKMQTQMQTQMQGQMKSQIPNQISSQMNPQMQTSITGQMQSINPQMQRMGVTNMHMQNLQPGQFQGGMQKYPMGYSQPSQNIEAGSMNRQIHQNSQVPRVNAPQQMQYVMSNSPMRNENVQSMQMQRRQNEMQLERRNPQMFNNMYHEKFSNDQVSDNSIDFFKQ
jgi:hypothetical protein